MADRLQKVMAQAGVASRRKSEELIATGHVTVNGQVMTELGYKVQPKDKIEVDGMPVQQAEKLVYYLLYKPRGFVSTAKDEKGRRTVVDLLTDVDERVYPVGRLDFDTTGALIMTNDGDLMNYLTHPKYEVDKVYTAKVEGIPTNDELMQLRHGIKLEGKMTKPARTKILNTKTNENKKTTTLVQITIHEGRNHQVKKMFKHIGHEVVGLRRESYGFLDLHGLQPGDYRELRFEEVEALKNGKANLKVQGRL
ncbi:pseudouridine synthase [Periweissella ghanensis]|uniref:Pseudouridine synthase n=1 Tax=Periweissella ghanensis TaxID=467997 RepID=A0ABM8Z9G5_9LACO|nr:pseudouridine synthase [Periweissella ghanensis]MCM0600411.1 rRNA pseudouridine synthase [Periweissella ghanensis]CAH0418125.1 Ribosomal large subunit pseudouridine synthase B [Periweissella ghanensis]